MKNINVKMEWLVELTDFNSETTDEITLVVEKKYYRSLKLYQIISRV
jgi:hypothetical protein